MMYGEERTGRIVRFADHCVHRTEQLLAELGIDCDYRPSGNIMAVVHPKQEKRLRRAAAVAEKVGAAVRFVEAAEMRRRGIPPAFLCGALEGSGGTLNPGKMVLGLRRAALDAGIPIYEQTPVQQVQEGPRPRVRAPRGTVTGDRVVMATNAWTGEIGHPRRNVAPLYITLCETAPLDDAQLEAIGGWPGREGIYTAHEVLESYRLTAERTSSATRRAHGTTGAPRRATAAAPMREPRRWSKAPSAIVSPSCATCRSPASGGAGSP